jgi:hypothetical protein
MQDGWTFTFSKDQGSSAGVLTEVLRTGTTIPPSTAGLIVFSENMDGVEVPTCAFTVVRDFSPPTEVAAGLFFEDTDPSLGAIGGNVTVSRMEGAEGNVTFRVYFGINGTHAVTGADALVAEIHAHAAGRQEGGVTNFTVVVPANTRIPAEATQLLAFVADSMGESLFSKNLTLFDFAPPTAAAQAVVFQDTEPARDIIGGTVTVTGAVDDPSITQYNVYWSRGAAGPTLGLLGFAGAVGAITRPHCEGTSCGSISISVVAGHSWEISRGTAGYGHNEQASISIQGPAEVSFTFFSTEANYDFVEVLGTSYSGSSLPPVTAVPEGSHLIQWRTDFSVVQSGWTCILTPDYGTAVTVPVDPWA